MQWFADLRTGAKLSLSFSLMMIILLIVMGFSYSSIRLLGNINQSFFSQELTLVENLMALRDNQSDINATILLIALSSDHGEQLKLLQNINKSITEQAQFSDNIQKLIQEKPAMKNQYDKITKTNNELALMLTEFISMINSGKIKEAKAFATIKIAEGYDKIGNQTYNLIQDVRNEASETLKRSNNEVKKAFLIFILISIIAILLVIALIVTLNHMIAGPLKEISSTAKLIASGDLNAIHFNMIPRRDEVGMLMDTFSDMTNWLKNIANSAKQVASGDLSTEVNLQSTEDVLGHAFQTMVKNMRKLTSEISQAVHLLSTSVSEISTATAELAASSTETATAISQTTSTIEEVKQTSLLASKKAKAVSDSSQQSLEVSKNGKKSADEMNEMTNQIHHQMNLIAESMIRLSEQSQAIGEFITTVVDMAQQSNLLSVNASIEAAKAGEQGKGFAIVAQEVKTLANQSKQATNQVRGILNDIQKATNAAVLATEQGSKSVDAGVKKSEETGQSILSLVTTINESTKAATQIAATSHQQLVGMEQAAGAMENVKQATVQNMEGAKQLEIACLNMKNMGTKLKDLVDQYKLKKNKRDNDD